MREVFDLNQLGWVPVGDERGTRRAGDYSMCGDGPQRPVRVSEA